MQSREGTPGVFMWTQVQGYRVESTWGSDFLPQSYLSCCCNENTPCKKPRERRVDFSPLLRGDSVSWRMETEVTGHVVLTGRKWSDEC